MSKERNNSPFSVLKKSAKQEAFEREAQATLENADMNEFDKLMKRIIEAPHKPEPRKGKSL